MTTFPVTGASCYTIFNCMKSDIQWSSKLRKTEIFSFNLNIGVPFDSVNLFLHVFFVSQGHFDNKTLHKGTHNFYLKIRNILELTTCRVKFGKTCPA